MSIDRWKFQDTCRLRWNEDKTSLETWSEEEFPDLINFFRQHFGDPEVVEVVLSVDVTGYSDPGKTYGPPEDCYPPEDEEERVITLLEGLDDSEEVVVRMMGSELMKNKAIFDEVQDHVDNRWDADYPEVDGPDDYDPSDDEPYDDDDDYYLDDCDDCDDCDVCRYGGCP